MGTKGSATTQDHTKLHKTKNQPSQEKQTNTKSSSTLLSMDIQILNNSFEQWIRLGSKDDTPTKNVGDFFSSHSSLKATQDCWTHNQSNMAT